MKKLSNEMEKLPKEMEKLSAENLSKIKGGTYCYLGQYGPCSTCWYQCSIPTKSY